MISDPYAVLGVSRNATPEEIKKAYRKMAKQYHPDLHPNDPAAAEKMNEINQAYDMINNPGKYRQNTYSSSASNTGQGYEGYRTASSQGQQQGRYTYETYGDPWVMFDDLFKEFYNQQQRAQSDSNASSQNKENYREYTYRRQSGGLMSILSRILRFFLIIWLMNFLLRGCSVLSYSPYYYNMNQPGQQYQQEYDTPGQHVNSPIGDT